MGSQEEIKIENDFTLIRFQNDGNENFQVKRHVNQGLIQFHFGIKGKAKFVFNDGNYADVYKRQHVNRLHYGLDIYSTTLLDDANFLWQSFR